jgi:hypothetical protein
MARRPWLCVRHGLVALGARTTGHANLARGHHQERTAFQLVSVFLEYGIEVVDLGVQVGSREPKENDAGVDESLVEDQLAEIAVGDHQHPSLLPGNGQDIRIGKTRRIVARDGLNVVATLAKVGNQSEVGALVEQEVHRAASDRAPFGGLGETSSPVTRSFA